MGVKLEKKTLGSSLLELCQQLGGYFPACGEFTVFLHIVKTIFVRNYNPIGI